MTPPCQITTTPFFFVAAAAAAPRAAFFLSPSPFFCRRTATAAERPQPFWREKREKPKPIPREQHPSSGLSGRRPLIQPRFWACLPLGAWPPPSFFRRARRKKEGGGPPGPKGRRRGAQDATAPAPRRPFIPDKSDPVQCLGGNIVQCKDHITFIYLFLNGGYKHTQSMPFDPQ